MPASDTDLESGMSRLLQAGVALAAAFMIAGGSLYLARQGGEQVSYRSFHSVSPDLKTVAGVWHGVLAGHPASIIQFGVFVMIATPVLRVAFAVVAFCMERDWLYTAVSMVVLALLSWALLGAA